MAEEAILVSFRRGIAPLESFEQVKRSAAMREIQKQTPLGPVNNVKEYA